MDTTTNNKGQGLPTPAGVMLAANAIERADRLFLENNVLRAAGVIFCHDKRQAAKQIAPITNLEEVAKRPITVEPHPAYGQPGPAAFRVFLGMMKKLSDYGQPVPNKIFLTQAELARLMGRAWAGTTGKQIVRALWQLRRTAITMAFHDRATGDWQIEDFNLATHLLVSGRDNQVRACVITIPEVVQRSLQERYFSCLNYSRLQGLSTVATALYLRLYHHFANLHENGGRNGAVIVRKRYDAICKEWLGGLTVLGFKSKIMSEQLGPHLDALKACGFLKSYGLDRAKNEETFVLTFRPGRAFFEDYEQFYKNRFQNELQFQYHAEEREMHRPMEVVRLFHEKRTGQSHATASLNENEVELAQSFIEQLDYEGALGFLDYGLAKARSTKFDVQNLAGLNAYLPSFIANRDAISRSKEIAEGKARAEHEQREQEAYEVFRRQHAERVLAEAPQNVREEIEAAARAEAAGRYSLGGRPTELGYQLARRRIVAERLGTPSFDEWKAKRRLN
jgi:hypothetical protein